MQQGQSEASLCLKCESISLILLYAILAAATIYFAGAGQDIPGVNIDTSLIICIVFVAFSGVLLLLCIYHMCANQKPKQLKRNNGYHQPNEPPPRVIPVEDETEPINTMKSDYKQQIIKIKQLTKDNEKLKNDNERLKNENQLQNATIEKMENYNRQLLESRKQQDSDINTLNKELEEYKTKVNQLNQEHQQQNTLYEEKKQLETIKQEYNLKEQQLKVEMKQTIDKLKQELELKQTTIQAVELQNNEMKEKITSLQIQLQKASQIKIEQESIVRGNQSRNELQSDYDALRIQHDTLTTENNSMKQKINVMINEQNEMQQQHQIKLQSLNDQLSRLKETELANKTLLVSKQSEIDVIQQQMDSLKSKLTKLEDENVRLKDELNNKIKISSVSSESNLKDENMRLKRELKHLQIAYDELDEFKKALQNRLCDLNENTISLNEDFPTVEDIIIKYDTLRGQNRQDCAKKIKSYFKKQPENKKVNKKWLSKEANQLLFKMLMTSYQKMRNYYIGVNKTFDNNKMDTMNKVVYHKLRQQFEPLFEEIKIEYSNEIVENAIEQQYVDVYKECEKKSLVKYVEGCLYICWFINVSQSPPLRFYPITLENNEDEKENQKENEEYLKILLKNEDNKDLYEYVAGSNEDEKFNYCVWPAIIRTDNNFALTRIYAFYMNNIPKNK